MKLINDLTRQDQRLLDQILDAMSTVVRKGWYILGPDVRHFEEAFSRYFSSTFCISVANGTDALEIALRALMVEKHDRVATAANAGFYSSTAILSLDAVPVYVDIDPGTMTMSPTCLEQTLHTTPLKAVIVTHLYGQMADIDALTKICNARNIPVIEDCAQAHGAELQGKYAGTWGALGCFSFFPTKNLGAIGDGGAILTNTSELAERIKKLRQYGWEHKYQNVLCGGKNSRLDDIQAAILNVKLPYLAEWNARRRQIARQYTRLITNPHITLPVINDSDYIAHLYVVRTDSRQALIEHLQQQQVGCDIHYPIPDYQQACLAQDYTHVHLPETENACASVVTLPCFPELTDKEVAMIADIVNSWRP